MKKKNFLLLGYGFSNQQVAKFLKKKRKKYKIWDDYNIIYQNIIDFNTIRCIIVSPGIKSDHFFLKKARNNNIPIKIDMDIFEKKKKDIFIGITGTNGKTTTIQMLSSLISFLPHQVGGNIGKSIFFLPKKFKNSRIFLWEVSSFQLHYLNKNFFHFTIITNIKSNHDEWHGSFEIYKYTKYKILTKYCFQSKSYWFIKNNNLYYNSNYIINLTNIFLYSHNQKNFLKSLKIYNFIHDFFKIKKDFNLIKKFLKNFKLDVFRQEIIYKDKFLNLFINDSKSTNIDSTNTAIKSFLPHILILGGQTKGILENLLISSIEDIYIFGENKNKIEKILKKNYFFNYKLFDNLNILLNYFFVNFNYKKKIILFSPGGSSSEEFRNYKKRGNFFNLKVFQFYSFLNKK